MSAIYGAYSPSAPLRPGLAASLARALRHRPADMEGHFESESCVLGARARFFAAARPAAVPYVDRRTGIVCVADGRIDGCAELAHALGLRGGEGLADEAIVVAAYARWGTAFPRRLLGDFAIALWHPHERRLLLVRDPYGVRALYYARLGEGVVFASQERALLAAPELLVRLRPLRLAQYLARDFGDCAHTFFEGVLRLEPGSALVADRQGVRQERYFALDPNRRAEPASSADYQAQFRELFLDAVRVRARSRVAPGLLLSGGLDSAGVLGALRQRSEAPTIACFSARFPDFPEIDEGAWLALHCEEGGVDLHTWRADRAGPLADIERLHRVLDEPFHAPNLFVYAGLAQLARAAQVPVLLDGLDGDSVVEHGFLLLNELLHRGRVRRLARELRALHRRAGASYLSLIFAFTLGPDMQRLAQQRARLGGVRRGYLSRRFAHDSGFVADARARAQAQLAVPADFHAMHHAALTAPVMPFYLEVHDKLAAAMGIDHRHPYFDRRLLEFCLALPAEQRLFRGWDRVIQRRAFEGLVPEPIRIRQSKSVWTPNFQRQLFRHHRPLIQELVESERSPLAPYCDLPRLRRDSRQLAEGAPPARVLDLWCAVTLGLWLRDQPWSMRD